MIEEKIFKKSTIIPKLCIDYGFQKKGKSLVFHKNIQNNTFEIIILIENSKLKGKIIDKELNEDYTNFRIEKQIGEFSTTIRQEFIRLLEDIKDKCTYQNSFIYPQSNRISQWIKEKYNDIPEYLWDDDKNAVFRNKTNKKWYGIIMYINLDRIDQQNKMVEVMNVKLSPEEIEKLVKKKGYYRAYHMNKKHWITFLLDDTIEDEKLQELIEKSYEYTEKNHK